MEAWQSKGGVEPRWPQVLHNLPHLHCSTRSLTARESSAQNSLYYYFSFVCTHYCCACAKHVECFYLLTANECDYFNRPPIDLLHHNRIKVLSLFGHVVGWWPNHPPLLFVLVQLM